MIWKSMWPSMDSTWSRTCTPVNFCNNKSTTTLKVSQLAQLRAVDGKDRVFRRRLIKYSDRFGKNRLKRTK